MTENQEHEHEWQEEDDDMICSKCKAWTFTKWFFDIRNEGIRIGRKEATLAENKRVLDAIRTNPSTKLSCGKCQNNDVLYHVTKSKLASLRLKEDEKK